MNKNTLSIRSALEMRAAINAKNQREAMRDGVKLRAQTFKNRKKEASRTACRGKIAW